MSDRLNAEEAAALLKTEPQIVEQLWEEGIFQALHDDGTRYTTRELLEGDIQVLTEAARIHRLRQGGVALAPGSDDSPDFSWLSLEWVDSALDGLRGGFD